MGSVVFFVLCELASEIFTNLYGRCYHHAHFTSVETEALFELLIHCQGSSVFWEYTLMWVLS